MQTRIYNGPFPEVEVPLEAPLEDGTQAIIATKDQPAEFPDELAARLDDQAETWLHADGESRDTKQVVPVLRRQAKEAGIKVPAKATRAEIEALLRENEQTVTEKAGERANPQAGDDQASGDPDVSATADGGKE